MDLDLSKKLARLHEGFRPRPYKDSAGVLTIGYGRNLEEGISREEAEDLLTHDLTRARATLMVAFPWFPLLCEARQAVLVDMCFNLGYPRLGGFKRFLAAVAGGQYATAKHEMLNSLWAQQVGQRAHRLAEMMRTGETPQEIR